MRARRHPGVVVGLWAWQASFALLVSAPAAATVRAAYGAHPEGDAPLWEPGGRALLELFWANARGTVAVARLAEIVLLAGAVAGLVPMAIGMFAIAHSRRKERAAGLVRSVTGALTRVPTLAMLLAVVWTAQALALAAGATAATFCEKGAHEAAGEARAQQLEAAVGLGFLLVAAALGIIHDLARAAVVRFGVNALGGLRIGLRAFALAPAALSWAWAWRALASFAPIAIAAAATARIDSTGGALFLALLVHQAAAATRIAFRASWSAKALRSVATSTRPALYRAESDRYRCS